MNELNKLYGINKRESSRARKNIKHTLYKLTQAVKEGKLDESFDFCDSLFDQKWKRNPTTMKIDDANTQTINDIFQARINLHRDSLLKDLAEIERQIDHHKIALNFKGIKGTDSRQTTMDIMQYLNKILTKDGSLFVENNPFTEDVDRTNADGKPLTRFEDLLDEFFGREEVDWSGHTNEEVKEIVKAGEKFPLTKVDQNLALTKKQLMQAFENRIEQERKLIEMRESEFHIKRKNKTIDCEREERLTSSVQPRTTDKLYELPNFEEMAKENKIKNAEKAKLKKTLENKAKKVGITYEQVLKEIEQGKRGKTGNPKGYSWCDSKLGESAEKEIAKDRERENAQKLKAELAVRKREMKTESSDADC
jgi:hypothetical protein